MDGTPLLGTPTGIGRYVRELLRTLPRALDERLPGSSAQLTTWSARHHRVDPVLRVPQVGPRVPARVLRTSWMHRDVPPIEWLVGRTDVFHGTNFVSPPTRRAREVVTIHDLTYELHADTVSEASLAYRELVPRALARGAHVVTPTRTVADAVADRYDLPTERLTVTPLGVDASWFAAQPLTGKARADLGVPERYFVFVGSLDPRKNLPRLLASHAALRDDDPEAPELVLAGPAGREASLTAVPGVTLTGWLADATLQSLVAGAVALVLPSIDEGFGLPALEALAVGRPVVAADIPVLREVVGGYAEYADPYDVSALAAALGRAARLPGEAAGRRERAGQFTWLDCARATCDAYVAVTQP